MKLKIAQIIGLNTDQKAAQVISSLRDGNAFLAVLEVTSDDAFTKGRAALSELEDFYFDFEGGAAEKLQATFEESGKKFDESVSEWSLCLATILDKALYIINKGAMVVYLKRADKLSPLLPVGASSQLISGFLTDGDKLLFSTENLTTFLGPELNKSLDLPVEAFEEEVGSKISTADLENKGLAGLIVEVSPPASRGEPTGGENLEIPPLPTQEQPGLNQSRPDRDQEDIEQIEYETEKFNLAGVLSLFKRFSSYFPKSGRGRLIVAAILIIVIAGGVGYKYKTSRDQEKQAQFNQILQAAKDDFNTAQGLSSLNPSEAKTKLDSAKDKVSKALSLEPNNKEAQDFKKQLEQGSSSILQQSSVANFPVFLDMDLVKKNFRATQLSLSTGKLLLLDPAVKTLVAIDLAKKSNQMLAGEEQLGDAIAASLNGGLGFIYSKDKGILKIDTTNQKVSVVTKKDSEWGGIKDIYGFGGNVYVLDSGNPPAGGQIWKYLPTADSYSDKRPYLSSSAQVDFNGVLRMQIESSVYVLKAGGEILRFTKGDKDNFSLAGLDKGVKDPKSIFISSDTDNLYVLDSGNSRMLILTKTGSYKGQITGDKFATATDLAVDEKTKKVYLLDGSKIYSIDLK